MKYVQKDDILTKTIKNKRNGYSKMNKTEYIQVIEKALVGNVSPQELQDIVSYYRDYIDMEIQKGRSEREVLDGLGNPRHLVKSILAAKEQKGVESSVETTQEEKENGRSRNFRIPLLPIIIIVLLIVWLALGFVVALARFVFPLLLPLVIIMGIISLIRRSRGR